MEMITRKSLLYRSGLGFYCVNHVQGCSHGCRYPCYAYMMASHYGRVKSYEEWCQPKIVSNAERLLEKELSRMKTRPDSVHLCLTTDPFMTGQPAVRELSLSIIKSINRHGIPCSVLTKGVLPAELADQQVFRADNRYQISLVSLSEGFRRRWEPGTTPYAGRIRALKFLPDHGCRTGIHMEPYPTPNLVQQDLEQMLERVAFVEAVYFSGWNYNSVSGQFPDRTDFYATQAKIVRRFCSPRRIDCEIGV
jgi:DNA repair photolyase